MPSSLHRLLLLLLLLAALMPGMVAAENGGSTVHEMTIDGAERSYIVYKPMLSPGQEVPLMIVLHGGLGNAQRVAEVTGMNEVADTGRFIVAYPNGTEGRFRAMQNRRTWNAGRCCGRAARQDIDDVSFLAQMIDRIKSRFPIDAQRVYVAGMSNGAMMAYRLACEIPEKIAAIITVSGTLAVDTCDDAKFIPVLHLHGDQDKHVPFEGGRGSHSVSWVAHRSVPDTVELMIRSRHCFPPEQRTDNGNLEMSSYRCRNGAPFQLFVIRGGEHVWPQGRQISASILAWEFAKQFSKNRGEPEEPLCPQKER